MLTREGKTTIENTTKILCNATNCYKNLLNVEMDGEVLETALGAILSVLHTVA